MVDDSYYKICFRCVFNDLEERCIDQSGGSVKIAAAAGSDDAFFAIIISKLIDRAPPADALDFESRLGAYIALGNGPCDD
jgi:hypothetical protein